FALPSTRSSITNVAARSTGPGKRRGWIAHEENGVLNAGKFITRMPSSATPRSTSSTGMRSSGEMGVKADDAWIGSSGMDDLRGNGPGQSPPSTRQGLGTVEPPSGRCEGQAVAPDQRRPGSRPAIDGRWEMGDG